MPLNPMVGACTVLAVAACLWQAYRLACRGREEAALWLVFLSALLLRAFAGADLFLHAWDERYHALAAKSLLAHPLVPTLYDDPALPYDYRGWTANHVWVHKPPLPLYLMAASMRLFGVNELALRLPSILLSSLGVFLTFRIARHFMAAKAALLAACFYAINGFLIELAAGRHPTDHVDTLFVFLVELGILLALGFARRRSWPLLVAIGLVTGLAVLTKWLPGLLVLGVMFLAVWEQGSPGRAAVAFVVGLAVACVVFVPWQVYIHVAFPLEAAWEDHFNGFRHMFEPLEGHRGTVFYHLELMPRIFGELIYIPLALYVHALLRGRLQPRSFVLLAWFAVPYLFFSIVATKMPGYVMIAAPAVFMMLAQVTWDLRERVAASSGWRRGLLALLLVLLVGLPIRYSLERVKPLDRRDRNPVWARELRALGERTRGSRAAVFNVRHPIEAMFYAPVTAYPIIPSRTQIDEVVDEGFAAYVYDTPDLPLELRDDPRVTVLRAAVAGSESP